MRVALAAIAILGITLTSADAHWRAHHQHHRSDGEPARLPDRPAEKDAWVDLHGPLQVIVSIRDQRVSIYRNGVAVAQSRVSTGTKDHPTPTGIFSVIERQRWHESNLYSLAPMPYMQRITWSGIALHAGIVPGHPASHGCIRLPPAFAKLLWGAASIGTRVVVAPTQTMPVEIAHPQLAALAQRQVEQPAPGDTAEPRSTNVMDATAKPNPAEATASTVANPPAADVFSDTPASRKTPPRGQRVSVLVSRKTGKLFVRAGFRPLFDAPVTIRQPETQLGTHVFTVMEPGSDGGTRWVAITMPDASPGRPRVKDQKEPLPNASETPDPARSPTASEVLDRIEIPPETMARIAELLSPGASLIVSDQGISHETGQGTDFVVLMPGDKPQQGAKALKTARRHAPRLYYARGFSRPHYARGFFGWGFPW